MQILTLTIGAALGFFLPGFLVSKLLGTRRSLLSDLLISSMVLFHVVFWLGIIGIPLRFTSILAVLSALSLLLLIMVVKFRNLSVARIFDPGGFNFDLKFSPFMIPVCLAVLLLLARSVLQPFNYSDAEYRWNHLALKILETGSFSFYPPVTAADFSTYFFVDGIPPLVSFGYFWIYASYGVPEMMLTGFIVALESLLILCFAYKIAVRLFPVENSGYYTVFSLVASTLFFFSLVMGQETGLTALSLAATIFYLVEEDESDWTSMLMAGVATAMGALTREYGCAFLICGISVCLWRREKLGMIALYAGTVLLLASPWYLRTWIITGNPFYSISSFGGLFNVNSVYCGLLKEYEACFGFSNQPATKIYYLFSSLLFTAPLQAGIGLVAIFFFFRKHGFLAISLLVVLALWIYSVAQTNGGFFHSMRVLSPALVILSIICGAVFSGWALSKAGRNLVNAGLCAFFIFAFLQDLAVPYNFWSLKTSEIPVAAFGPVDYVGSRIFNYIEPLPDNARIIGDSPFYHAALSAKPERGIALVPAWSPELEFLFKDGPMDEKMAKLKEKGIRYIMLEKGSLNNAYYEKFAFFREFRKSARPFVMENDYCVIHELH